MGVIPLHRRTLPIMIGRLRLMLFAAKFRLPPLPIVVALRGFRVRVMRSAAALLFVP